MDQLIAALTAVAAPSSVYTSQIAPFISFQPQALAGSHSLFESESAVNSSDLMALPLLISLYLVAKDPKALEVSSFSSFFVA